MQPVLEITLEMNRKRVVKKISRHMITNDPSRAQVYRDVVCGGCFYPGGESTMFVT